jgi:hypothetical protein
VHRIFQIRLPRVLNAAHAAAALLIASSTLPFAVSRAAAQAPSPPAARMADDPAVQRVSGLVSLLLRNDFAGAERYLRANTAPGSMAAAAPGHETGSFQTLLAAGGFRLTGIARERGLVVAQLQGGGGRRLAVQVEVEPTAPHRIRDVRPGPGDRPPPPAGPPLAPEHPASVRAAELVAALNAPGEDATRRLVARSWVLKPGETADSVVAELAEISVRVGAGLTLSGVTRGDDGQVEVEVNNRRGRRSTVTLAVEPQAPHRVSIAGLALQPEREAEPAEYVPAVVELATPVVTVPLVFANGRPLVDVTIGGKGPFRLMLETGCGCIELAPRTVAAVGGLEALTDDKLYRVAGGFVDGLHRVAELRIGGARLGGFVATTDATMPGVDGLIGLPAFAGLLLTVDYPNRQLRLEKGALPVPDGKNVLPMRNIFGVLLGIDMETGGGTLPTVIDTQSGLALSLSPELASGLRFESAPVQTGEVLMGGTVTAPVKTGRLAGELRIGEFVLPRQLAQVITHPPDRPRLANIGAEILRHFAVTLDQQNMRVRFTRAGPTTLPAPGPYRGFGLVASSLRDGTARVSRVDAGGAADRAGLKAGDVVVRVDGAPLGTLRENGVSAQAALIRRAQDPAPVTLEVRRDGQPVTVTLASEVVVP